MSLHFAQLGWDASIDPKQLLKLVYESLLCPNTVYATQRIVVVFSFFLVLSLLGYIHVFIGNKISAKSGKSIISEH